MRSATKAALVLLGVLAIAPVMAQDQPLPKGDTILDKYIEVTGGKAAYEKIHSAVMTGTIELGAMGMKAKMTTYHAEPALLLEEMEIQGIGKILEGCDGKVAWSLSAMQGARLKEGDEKTEALRDADLHGDEHWRDHFTKAETVGVENVEGKACYKVVLTPKVGSPQTRYYDKETNLLVKTVRTVKGPMGEINAEAIAADYQKTGDILAPRTMMLKAAGQDIKMTIESIQYNTDIPKEKFDLPDEIKALLAKGK